MRLNDSDMMDFSAEREYMDEQEYNAMMSEAPDDFWPDEDDYPNDEPDSALDEELDYDGQPDEYTEWQDVYGGDDWDHGQYDEFGGEG